MARRVKGSEMVKKTRFAMLGLTTAAMISLGATAASACTSTPGHGPGQASVQGISTGGTGLINVDPVICGNNLQIPVDGAVPVLTVPVLSPVTSSPATAVGDAGCQGQQGANN